MPIGLPLALGIAGAAGNVAGGAIQAGAASGAAASAAAAQEKTRAEATAAAQPSAQELSLLDKQLQTTEAGLKRQQQLLSAVDPALMAAGKQALDLLGGKEAGILAPMKAEQDRQRQRLEARLRDQLGPGYATSSAGIEALSRFDAQSQAQLTQAQQSAIGQLLGTSQQTVAGSGAGFQGTQALGIPLAGYQNIAGRKVNAITGTPVQGINPGAVGAGVMGQTLSGVGSGIAGLGGQLMGFDMLKSLLPGGGGGGGGGAGGDTGLPMGHAINWGGPSDLNQYFEPNQNYGIPNDFNMTAGAYT